MNPRFYGGGLENVVSDTPPLLIDQEFTLAKCCMSITWCSFAFFKSLHAAAMEVSGRCQVIIIVPQLCLIHNVDIWSDLYSTSVAVGDSAQFNCFGIGSYLYWYIDGVNTEDMNSQEIADRGISFYGYYNHYPPYQGCNIQDSYLTMGGNCLNNNSQIHCVVLGYYVGGNSASNAATLTVEG